MTRARSFSEDSNTKEDRQPYVFNNRQHKDYNRHNYYWKLRTEHKRIMSDSNSNADDNFQASINDADFLVPPMHVIDNDLFVFKLPFSKAPQPGEKMSSMVIIFSCWKTMLGSAVVSLPWAFQ
jgi:hypothetical protein